MEYSSIIDRLHAGGADGWALHRRARERKEAGEDIIELSIGEPDVPADHRLVEATAEALRSGRTAYAASAGESALRSALAARYSASAGRPISADQIIAFPGTQTALYVVLRAVAGSGDRVVAGDPMYATYESVVNACDAVIDPVALRSDRGFRIDPADIEAAITPRTTAVLLNTPHNPTGAVLTGDDIEAIGDVATRHDLWIVSDEVYEEMVFPGAVFTSPLAHPDLAERTVVLNSVSKSHAAPGLRSGWCVASEAFCADVLPLAEAVLFGNQPFIADGTAAVVGAPSEVARGMADRFAARATRLADRLHARTALRVHQPEAGMFALVDVSSTGMTGEAWARSLLDTVGVAVMPGASFGTTMTDWIRVALTRPDDEFDEACARIVRFATGGGNDA